MILAFHKPYGVLSQFTPDGSPHRSLAEFDFPKGFYSIGRLDADSEGLLLLSDESALNKELLHPRKAHQRTYWVQVERIPRSEMLQTLARGLVIQGYKTLPASARILDPQPAIPSRVPPIRYRKSVPDIWLEIILVEGKNRQVRHMTAAIGHPTLRLIRTAIGRLRLPDLALESGEWRELNSKERSAAVL